MHALFLQHRCFGCVLHSFTVRCRCIPQAPPRKNSYLASMVWDAIRPFTQERTPHLQLTSPYKCTDGGCKSCCREAVSYYSRCVTLGEGLGLMATREEQEEEAEALFLSIGLAEGTAK